MFNIYRIFNKCYNQIMIDRMCVVLIMVFKLNTEVPKYNLSYNIQYLIKALDQNTNDRKYDHKFCLCFNTAAFCESIL